MNPEVGTPEWMLGAKMKSSRFVFSWVNGEIVSVAHLPAFKVIGSAVLSFISSCAQK